MKIKKIFQTAKEFVDYVFANPKCEIWLDACMMDRPYMRFDRLEDDMVSGCWVGQAFITARREDLLHEFKEDMYVKHEVQYIAGIDPYNEENAQALSAGTKTGKLLRYKGRDKGDSL